MSPAKRVEILDTSARGTEVASASLFQRRLRAATAVVAFGFGVFLIRSFIVERPLQLFHSIVVLVEIAIIWLLRPARQYSIRQLRGFELVAFALPFLFFIPYQHLFMSAQAAAHDPVGTLAAMKSVNSYWLLAMLIYGLMIPNTWKRAAVICLPLTIIPILVAMWSASVNPAIAEVVTWDSLSDAFLILVIGAYLAVQGTHVVNALREEVSEAKQYGQYRLVRRIATGGMGKVYLAEHRLLARPCAIKLVRQDHVHDGEALRRFEREVRATAELTHWNTIEIYDFGRAQDGTFYYVMEYLSGLDVSKLIRRRGHLPPARVIHLLRQLCAALAEAHDAGMIHRDIKPGNIIVTERGGVHDVIKLLDFGLVKATTGTGPELTQASAINGTPHYMAPEQIHGEDLTPRCDLYALGAVAYEMLAGHPPFDHENVIMLLGAQVGEPVPPFPEDLEIPQDLAAVIWRCLEKDPDDRYAGAEELSYALASCADAGRWSQDDARACRAAELETPRDDDDDVSRPATITTLD